MAGRPPRPRPNGIPGKAAGISSNASTGSGSYSGPSSVMCVPASPLTRELSDLSGSYMNGNTNPRSSNRFILNHSSSNLSSNEDLAQGLWRQAHILSVAYPVVKEPQQRPAAIASPALIVVERNGVIELVKKSLTDDEEGEEDSQGVVRQKAQSTTEESNAITRALLSSNEDLLFLAHATPSSSNNPMGIHQQFDVDESTRIPILILLLEPGRKQYEIMQLWVDPQTDMVRDVLHTLQRKLSDKWRQDYDGLFQLRGSDYCQLVHILNIAKYDVRPRELWVAKPWSMAAKSATDLATECIGQLRASGLLSVYSNGPSSGSSKSRIKNFLRGSSGRSSPTFQDDKPLTLSEGAVSRLYVPDGTFMNHHHAHQFLSFRTPSVPPRTAGAQPQPHQHRNQHRFFDSLLGTSSSFDDASSQMSNSSDALLLPSGADNNLDTTTSSTAGSTSSPSGRRHQHQQRGNNSTTRFSSHFGPTLPAVGEGMVSSTKNSSAKSPNTSHYILADLEVTTNSVAGGELEADNEQRTKKKSKSRLKQLLAPLNCANCHRKNDDTRELEDEYLSSWVGDGSSSGAKNSTSNNNGDDSDQDGRDTPTSKGSAGDESLTWNNNSNTNKCLEDGSIISESAPLLASMMSGSSSYANIQIQSAGQQNPQQHQQQDRKSVV